MDYYFLSRLPDLKIVGKYPQLEKMFDGFNMQRRYEAFETYRENTITSRVKLSGFQLKYHAKITDMISAAQFGGDCELISNKFYELICQFRLMPHIAIPSAVTHHGKQYTYQFVYFPNSYYQFVDYEKSKFYLKEGSSVYKGDIYIKNYQQYNNEQAALDKKNEDAYRSGNSGTYINVSEFYLDESAINLDFFRIARMFSNIIVSERLKNAMTQAGLTGVGFNAVYNMNLEPLGRAATSPAQAP